MRSEIARKVPMPTVFSALLMSLFMLSIFPLSATAQMTTSADAPGWQNGNWHWGVGLYGWFQNIHGQLQSPDGTEHDFDISFEEIFSTVEGGLEAIAEVGWRQWSLVFDGTWATLGGDYQGTTFDLDVELKQQIYDVHAGYGVFRHVKPGEEPAADRPWSRISAVEVILGARYFGTQTTLIETTHLTGNTHQTEVDASRWDPFFGARGAYSFASRWAVYFIGDLGGFGIGNAAQFTYQVEANVAFRISHPLSAFAGYRVLGYTLEDDAGDETTFTQYGPKIGAALTF